MNKNLPEHAWHVAVLVPARNEEALLARCLRSIQVARAFLPSSITSDVVVVSDGSTDRTVSVAVDQLSTFGMVVEADAGCVGAARSLAATVALKRAKRDAKRCWLANTDADCDVPADWLLRQVALADQGYGAVAGIVDVDTFEEHSEGVRNLFRSTYLLHEDGTHPHVHGANLGVRGDVYLCAGGWRDLANAEDHDLWKRLQATGCLCLSTSRLAVLTSGRRIGRAPNGFAEALAAHNGPAA